MAPGEISSYLTLMALCEELKASTALSYPGAHPQNVISFAAAGDPPVAELLAPLALPEVEVLALPEPPPHAASVRERMAAPAA